MGQNVSSKGRSGEVEISPSGSSCECESLQMRNRWASMSMRGKSCRNLIFFDAAQQDRGTKVLSSTSNCQTNKDDN